MTSRPEILFPVFADITTISGVGPRLAKLFAKLGITRIIDLLLWRPRDFVDRSYRPTIADAEPGRIATLKVTIEHHSKPASNRQPYRITVRDQSGFMSLVYFRPNAAYLEKTYPTGEDRWVSGTIEDFQGQNQMVHPDFAATDEEMETHLALEPVYPLTAGLTNKMFAKAVRGALPRIPDLPEWQDPAFRAQQNWPDPAAALKVIHAPESEADLASHAPAVARLAFDELLATQLALGLMRAQSQGAKGRVLKGTGAVSGQILSALPFSLTGSQALAMEEIGADMAGDRRMVRLLQGDVGSGKTVVALLALAVAVEAGAQGAFMAPTEILARQHLDTIAPLAEAAGLKVALLTGRDKGKARAALLEQIAAGEINIVVGTHALFQADVVFDDLALVVVDEQHRFGVHQRLALSAKGRQPTDLLVMTATPIPRTLTLALYGDMEVSRLTEKPPGRKPVQTAVVPNERMDEVVAHLGQALGKGAQAYWVCPLVEESELVDLAAAEDRARELEYQFPGKVGLIHGRLPSAEKEAVMARFQAGELGVLVATTVIEVGVNVPNATIMVVEHAERFGLSQLHQLRGRVGRGAAASTCLLLYRPPLGDTAKARLKVLRETEDGFVIAEEDLRLRGTGDLLGSRQSGLPALKIADYDQHADLLNAARDDAKLILLKDPNLDSDRGKALRVLLYLFERDEAVRLLKAG